MSTLFFKLRGVNTFLTYEIVASFWGPIDSKVHGSLVYEDLKASPITSIAILVFVNNII